MTTPAATTTRNRLFSSPRRMLPPLFVITVLVCCQEVAAFHNSFATMMTTPRRGGFAHRRSIVPSKNTRPAHDHGHVTTTSLNGLEVAASAFDDFFRTQPFLSAFLACSVKASAADFLAQTSSKEEEEEQQEEPQHGNKSKAADSTKSSSSSTSSPHQTTSFGNPAVNVHQNLAFLLYGGLYQGMFLQFLYLVVYPCLFGESEYRIILSVCSDIFCFGPFVTLPIAYILRAIMDDDGSTMITFEDHPHDEPSLGAPQQTSGSSTTNSSSIHESFQQGIAKYKNHVATQGLLFTYWSIWGPAQSLNFGFVPEHYRVFFVAFISFFWVYLLSGISSQQEIPTATQATTTT
jgi:hypothetical protein